MRRRLLQSAVLLDDGGARRRVRRHAPTPTNPTNPVSTIETFSGVLTINGAVTFPFYGCRWDGQHDHDGVDPEHRDPRHERRNIFGPDLSNGAVERQREHQFTGHRGGPRQRHAVRGRV